MSLFLRSSSRMLIAVLIAVLGFNQLLLTTAASAAGIDTSMTLVSDIFHIKAASAKTIIMPVLNPDGRTTSLKSMPTISDVLAEPRSGDPIKNATTVMIGTGSPTYAPNGISFSDPLTALSAWDGMQNLQIAPDLEQRFTTLTNMLTCNFCCGSPTDVTINARCACKHAQAARGFFRYMLKTYGNAYTNDQLVGEAYRWQAVWYPAGVVQDYLLATGKGNVLKHETHGGAGSDGLHGISVKP